MPEHKDLVERIAFLPGLSMMWGLEKPLENPAREINIWFVLVSLIPPVGILVFALVSHQRGHESTLQLVIFGVLVFLVLSLPKMIVLARKWVRG